MPLKIDAQTISSIADEKLGNRPELKADIHRTTGLLPAIARASAIDDPAAGKRQVQALITEVLSATGRLLEDSNSASYEVASITALERFAVLHFVSVQRALLKGLEIAAANLIPKAGEAASTADLASRRARDSTDRVGRLVAGIEMPYTMVENPVTQLNSYFHDYLVTVAAILEGDELHWGREAPLAVCSQNAMAEYVTWSKGDSSAAKAVRSYLNYEHQQQKHGLVLDDVQGLGDALKSWLKNDSKLSERRQQKWSEYRQALTELPDQKETMFDENFGVRQVFVQPTAQYRVAGVKREKPAEVVDVAALLGTLISERTQGDDLILLCGGPGSGKSTLCRVLASELASNEMVHPVFLRLRRLQESRDITGFIESQLQQEGLISKFSDLADVPNLVLILDGFDELVMASRTKLREFFHALKDDLSSGPLRHAKAIISGRDTLFPNGAGLPIGAHVISLMPFDKPRIAAWSEKWRSLHTLEAAQNFRPEDLANDEKKKGKQSSPLQHLVSWPLTLHLVARAHTSGSINLEPNLASKVEKAALYRSIVADTALRQENQASGKGRLNSLQMRQFVQAIAWEMYSSGREALDVSEGLPILKKILPGATDQDLTELADVTIVNQPELTRGEETGFEFVHKSFSEYFAAEQIATGIERVAHQSEQWGTSEKTWAMSEQEGTRSLATLFAPRLMTAEVQEMLEPMLVDFKRFLAENSALEPLDAAKLIEGMERKLRRFEQLISFFGSGQNLDAVNFSDYSRGSELNPLEAYGNYTSSLLFIAVALVRRMRIADKSHKRLVHLTWPILNRCLHIVLAGDIHIDISYAARGLRHLTVQDKEKETIDVLYPPVAPGLLEDIRGLSMPMQEAVSRVGAELAAAHLETLFSDLRNVRTDFKRAPRRATMFYKDAWRDHYWSPLELLERITATDSWGAGAERHHRQLQRHLEKIMDSVRESASENVSARALDEVSYRLSELLHRNPRGRTSYSRIYEQAEHMLRELAVQIRASERNKKD